MRPSVKAPNFEESARSDWYESDARRLFMKDKTEVEFMSISASSDEQ